MEKMTCFREASFDSHLRTEVAAKEVYFDICPFILHSLEPLLFQFSVLQSIVEVDLLLVLGFYIVIMENFKHYSS